MLSLYPKTLSPSPFNPRSFLIPKKPSISSPPLYVNSTTCCQPNQITERGILFDTGDTFFRHESATGRDLGVLSAALYKQSKGQLRVLDAMCGCGVRSLRYLVESKADFVLANDANESHRRVILDNLAQVERLEGEKKRWVVTHCEASRILTDCYLQRDYFDYIDLDSFGSDSSFFLRAAFSSLKLDGLVYVTSTDGYSAGGHRPFHSLSAFGAYVRPMPYANELGLRILIGGAVREASVLGYRIMVSSTTAIAVEILKQFHGMNLDAASLVVSGPLWTGPLHSGAYIMEMLNLAEQWGWVGKDAGTGLEKLLKRMLEESDPRLPFGYIKLDEVPPMVFPPKTFALILELPDVASRAQTNTPSISTIMSSLHKEGYAASRSHIAHNAIKTDCPMAGCIRIAKKIHGC
ncbi:tRNA (guanine(26)-N(2))-dimethyltransferase isoform X1 [Gossypium australe]|uniref:tRNA (Guanine(26)-N(2))-dimethyltransferase isoform X1 n=1 Tax=Gossypium australe TaxID=47621 RepID=A0A5B6U5X7_9ROSI|nr:tRNA (guanine(26)-N(2))-dimethyltransferase isoform X1 [Gossypium australe]